MNGICIETCRIPFSRYFSCVDVWVCACICVTTAIKSFSKSTHVTSIPRWMWAMHIHGEVEVGTIVVRPLWNYVIVEWPLALEINIHLDWEHFKEYSWDYTIRATTPVHFHLYWSCLHLLLSYPCAWSFYGRTATEEGHQPTQTSTSSWMKI